MLFAVKMEVNIPHGLDAGVRAATLADEKSYSQELQRSGVWRHIWRCVGEYSNLSIFDVDDNEHLHRVLWALPLFAYMKVEITPLAAHPSDIATPV